MMARAIDSAKRSKLVIVIIPNPNFVEYVAAMLPPDAVRKDGFNYMLGQTKLQFVVKDADLQARLSGLTRKPSRSTWIIPAAKRLLAF